MNQYFGTRIPKGTTPIKTPVGEICLYCEEAVEEGDSGEIMPFGQLGEDRKTMSFTTVAVHQECALRQVVGSIGHLKKQCSCYGGTEHDDLGMTRHEAALAVRAWVAEHGV